MTRISKRKTGHVLSGGYKFRGKNCFYCGKDAQTHDHFVPRILGGGNEAGNLVPACASCNSRKNFRTVDEYRLLAIVRGLIKSQYFAGETITAPPRDFLAVSTKPHALYVHNLRVRA